MTLQNTEKMSRASRNQAASSGSNVIERNSNEEPHLILNDPSTTQLGFTTQDDEGREPSQSIKGTLEREFFKDRIISNNKRSTRKKNFGLNNLKMHHPRKVLNRIKQSMEHMQNLETGAYD